MDSLSAKILSQTIIIQVLKLFEEVFLIIFCAHYHDNTFRVKFVTVQRLFELLHGVVLFLLQLFDFLLNLFDLVLVLLFMSVKFL